MEDKKIVKVIGGISIILGCYYLFLLSILFDIRHNISMILNINTSQADYESALTTLFIFAAVSIIPLILYVIGGFLVFKLRALGRSILIGSLVITLFATACNAKSIFFGHVPIINTVYYIFYTMISIALLLFLNSRKVKTIFGIKHLQLQQYQSIIGRVNDLLVSANIIRRGKKTYLPAWSVIATFLLPIFLIYLAIEYNNIIFAWLIIPCMIIFPLIGGYVARK